MVSSLGTLQVGHFQVFVLALRYLANPTALFVVVVCVCVCVCVGVCVGVCVCVCVGVDSVCVDGLVVFKGVVDMFETFIGLFKDRCEFVGFVIFFLLGGEKKNELELEPDVELEVEVDVGFVNVK